MELKVDGSKVAKFLLYSFVGIFMFFIPIKIDGNSSIPLDHIVNFIRTIPYFSPVYGGIIVTLGAILPFVKGTWKKDISTTIFSFLKLIGIVFVSMAILNKGPDFLMAPNVIPFIFEKIVVAVTTIVPIGSIFLAFLINYGLMEFIGVFMQPIMSKVWKTPGKSAIDAVASFVGSYSLALLITDKVYKEGKYTGKESAIIATGFSTVSATFMVIIAKTLDIMNYWLLYFWTTILVTFLVTAITARIYPLNKKPDTYYLDQEGHIEVEPEGKRFSMAYKEAMDAFDRGPSVINGVIATLKDGIGLALAIGPLLMSIGVIGIVLANHTPIFDVVGYIFYPFMALFKIPEPLLAAKAVSLSIVEMFLPAPLVAESPLITKFLIAIVSVSEILFFSASIPCIMATEIPLTIKDYLIIWVERVILSIAIAAPLLHLIFKII